METRPHKEHVVENRSGETYPGSFDALLENATKDISGWEGAERAFKEIGRAAEIGVVVQELVNATKLKKVNVNEFKFFLKQINAISRNSYSTMKDRDDAVESWKKEARDFLKEKKEAN